MAELGGLDPDTRRRVVEEVRAALTARAVPGVDPDVTSIEIAAWAEVLVERLRAGGTLFTFGNGGSASDAQHLAAELVGRFEGDRRPFAAVALTTDPTALTAIANDFGFEQVFARQVHALAREGDVVIGISTSGQSANVLRGFEAASAVGAYRLALVGSAASLTGADVDRLLAIGGERTPLIQEAHRVVTHLVCEAIDAFADAAAPSIVDQGRVVDLDEAVRRTIGWRAAGRRIVTTNGCFDLLHEGHVLALDEARSQGDHLVVLVNTDESVRRLKGDGRPALSFAQRARVLGALRAVDLVVPLDDDTPITAIERLRPAVHCKGSSYQPDDLPEAAAVIAGGGRIHLTSMIEGRSTSGLLDGLGRR